MYTLYFYIYAIKPINKGFYYLLDYNKKRTTLQVDSIKSLHPFNLLISIMDF